MNPEKPSSRMVTTQCDGVFARLEGKEVILRDMGTYLDQKSRVRISKLCRDSKCSVLSSIMVFDSVKVSNKYFNVLPSLSYSYKPFKKLTIIDSYSYSNKKMNMNVLHSSICSNLTELTIGVCRENFTSLRKVLETNKLRCLRLLNMKNSDSDENQEFFLELVDILKLNRQLDISFNDGYFEFGDEISRNSTICLSRIYELNRPSLGKTLLKRVTVEFTESQDINLLVSAGYFTNTIYFGLDLRDWEHDDVNFDFKYLPNIKNLHIWYCDMIDVDVWDTIIFQNGAFLNINELQISYGLNFFKSLIKIKIDEGHLHFKNVQDLTIEVRHGDGFDYGNDILIQVISNTFPLLSKITLDFSLSDLEEEQQNSGWLEKLFYKMSLIRDFPRTNQLVLPDCTIIIESLPICFVTRTFFEFIKVREKQGVKHVLIDTFIIEDETIKDYTTQKKLLYLENKKLMLVYMKKYNLVKNPIMKIRTLDGGSRTGWRKQTFKFKQ